jgi:hypothetical protein
MPYQDPATAAEQILKALNCPAQISYKMTPEAVLEILKVCSKNLTLDGIYQVISWIVNNHLELFIKTILRYDRSLFNKLFDPSESSRDDSSSVVITKAAVDNLDFTIDRTPKETNQDIYAMTMVFDMSQSDFDEIVKEKFIAPRPPAYGQYPPLGEFFDIQHIPKLLKMLQNSADRDLFVHAWRVVDETHSEMIQEFIWERMFDLSGGHHIRGLNVENSVQFGIVQNIMRKSSARLKEYKNVPNEETDKALKCILWRNFSEELRAQYTEEIQENNKIREVAAHIIFLEYLHVGRSTVDISFYLEEIFLKAEETFQLEIIAAGIASENRKQAESLLYDFLHWLTVINCLPAHVKIMIWMLQGEPDKRKKQWLSGLAEQEYFGNISLKDAKDFLLLLFRHDCVQLNYLLWMFGEYPFELKRYEAEIKKWCLRQSSEPRVFLIVREVVSKESQDEFIPIMLNYLQRAELRYLRFPIKTENREFLELVRQRINEFYEDPSRCKDPEGLGALVAYYGDKTDLETGLKIFSNLDRPQFVTGLILNPLNDKLKLTPSLTQKILEHSRKCVFVYASNQYSGRERYRRIDFHRSYLYRNNIIDEEIMEERKLCEETWYASSKFEHLVATNMTINKEQLVFFLKSGKFYELKKRVKDVWDRITEDAKESICQVSPYFNVLYRPLPDPRFRAAALNIIDPDLALPAFEATQAYSGILCTAKVELCAHWFFIGQFEKQIETGGYLGLFEVASHAIMNFESEIMQAAE